MPHRTDHRSSDDLPVGVSGHKLGISSGLACWLESASVFW